MAPVTGEKNFYAAVRHLFRHIGDPGELRTNPIIRGYFEMSSGSREDRMIVPLLHKQILRLAAELDFEGTPANQRYQFQRGKTIIEGICYGDKAARVAGKLSLSLRQYYRERQIACVRVARRLLKESATISATVDGDDALDLAVRRARLLAEQGFSWQAISLLERERYRAGAPRQQEAICLHLCRTWIMNGNVDQAIDALTTARKLQQRAGESADRGSGLAVLRSLASLDVAIATADAAAIHELLDGARGVRAGPRPLSLELMIELLVESSNHALLYSGEFREASESLGESTRLGAQLKRLPSYIEILISMQAALCIEYSADVPEQNLSSWDYLLRLSESLGSPRGCYHALAGLVRYYLLLGVDERAYDCFTRINAIISSMEGDRAMLGAARVATHFLKTKFWREVVDILERGRAAAYPGSRSALHLEGAWGQYLARCGRLADAESALDSAIKSAQVLHNVPLQGSLLREYSLVLYRLGRTKKAKQYIKEAVLLTEKGSDPLSRKETYRTATGILMDNLELMDAKSQPNSIQRHQIRT